MATEPWIQITQAGNKTPKVGNSYEEEVDVKTPRPEAEDLPIEDLVVAVDDVVEDVR